MTLRIRSIKIQGFRGFGTACQTIGLPDTVAAIWGGNSQGKTSLAEAVEFLLAGNIARRELLASSKDEFSHSLRNAHIPAATDVYVEAVFECPDGQSRKLRRTLSSDYDGADDCRSTLTLDGAVCAENDIERKIGLKLLHPPLRAPVLAQHTLAYVFSASPSDRASYFRAVLDTQDIENFRNAVASLAEELHEPHELLLDELNVVATLPGLSGAVLAIAASKDVAALNTVLERAVTTFLSTIAVIPETTHALRVAQILSELETRRKGAFPLELFATKELGGWVDPAPLLAKKAERHVTERKAVDAETRRLVLVYQSALSIHSIAECADPVDCPVCGTEAALTPVRVAHIRKQVANNQAYHDAENALADELRTLDGKLRALADSTMAALPRFAQITSASRRVQGFRISRILELTGNVEATKQWLEQSRQVWHRVHELERSTASVRRLIRAALNDLDHWEGADALREAVALLNAVEGALRRAHASYAAPSKRILALVKAVVDQSANTIGWEQLALLAEVPNELLLALSRRRTHEAQVNELVKALRQIDGASGKVVDEKFEDLSDEVTKWWELLRPGERAFFRSVQRRSPKARRTIDLKVSLSASDDRSNPKLRDAVAVFSQSQLHCLGLSLFLARAIDANVGFVVLDDPVLSSDDDFRPNFATSVIEALLAAGVQVIVVTQDNDSWRDIGHRWEHKGVAQFQMVRDDPVSGTEIRSQTDALATMIARATPYIHSQDMESRKTGAGKIRDAIERFAKEMLVKARKKAGDTLASITAYDQNFGAYSAQVKALLTKDASHPGKLTAAHNYVTPGSHDDTPPSTAQLKMALGELKMLKKEYLE